MSQKMFRLSASSVLTALSVVLGMFSVAEMPFGGSVTPASMLPLLLVGFLFGNGYGLAAGFVTALFN
ncbi:MAG: energy-coupled thiamine transporter ThiT, partial [Clostridia bacterium]|nr:energy-coupled thiamine transporter ThiT [Clostridia bacterium]